MSRKPSHAPMNQRSFDRYHKTAFQMPTVEKQWAAGPTGWQISPDHPLALFLSMSLILLVTYVLDRRTRQGIGRRNRRLFHLLLCAHGVATLLIFYNYIKQ